MFRNCKTFNEKNSKLYIQGMHMEDYYKLIISPIKKNRLINKNYNPNFSSNKISINFNDNLSGINEQSENKKINISKVYSNDSNNNNINITNNENNNKFHIPYDISDFNSINESNSVDLFHY